MLNVRSLRKNFDNAVALLESLDRRFDIVVFTEVWVREDEKDAYVLPSFSSILCSSKKSAAGGVMIFYNENFDIEKSEVLLRENCEGVSLIIRINKNIKVKICGVYRSPNYKLSCVKNFIDDDLPIICDASHSSSDIIFLGDVNINIVNGVTSPICTEYLNSLASMGFDHCIEDITRLESKTCIDHVAIKSRQLSLLESEIIPRADHCAIVTVFQYKEKRTVQKRKDNKVIETIVDKFMFKKHMFNHDWNSFFKMDVAETACNYLVNACFDFQESSKRVIHSKKVIKKLKPWLSYNVLKKYRTLIKKPLSKDLRNDLRNKIRREKQSYFRKQFAEAGHDSRKKWSIINRDLRGKSKKMLNLNDIVELKDLQWDKLKLDTLNKFLANMGKSIAQSVGPSMMDDNLEHKQPTYTHFQFYPPPAAAIQCALKLLKKSNAIGADGIMPSLIRECEQLICILLEHLFKLCIRDGVFPSAFKTSVVTPLHKGGIKCFDNLRPISVPCFLGKIFEKCLQLQLSEYFEQNELISEFQFGFKKGSRTEDAVLLMQHFVTSTIEADQIPLVIFLDLRKAFDTISRERLLKKLKLAGFNKKSLQLLASFLHERKQIIRQNGLTSDKELVEFGLPQGSLLSPLFFNFFINDIHDFCDNSLKIQFADDTGLCYALKSLDDLKYVSRNFSIIRNYLSLNWLSLNISKTKVLVFRPKGGYEVELIVHNCDNYESVTCSCPRIKNSKSVEYLGVIIQDDLKWNSQIMKIMKKLRSTCAVMRSIRNLVAHDVLRNIYFSLFESHINYCLLVYGGSRVSLLEMVFRMQKKALRILCNADKRAHSKELFEKERIRNVYSIYSSKLLDFFQKNLVLFINDRESSHSTRSSKTFKKKPSISFLISEQTPYFKVLNILNNDVMKNFDFNDNSFSDDFRKLKSGLETMLVEDLKVLLYH